MSFKYGNLAMDLGMPLLMTGVFNKVFGPGSLKASAANHLMFNGLPKFSMPQIPQVRAPKAPGIASATTVDYNKLNENINSLYKISSVRNIRGERSDSMEKISSYDVKVVNDLVDHIYMTKQAAKRAKEVSFLAKAGTSIFENLLAKPAGNAISKYVEHVMDKKLNPVAPKGRLLELLESPAAKAIMPVAGLTALGGIGLAAASSAADHIKDAVKKQLSYRQMFDEFPELSDMPRTQVDKYWNVLNDFAPKLTTNPLVAGQFIANMSSYGMRGVDHNVVGQLAKIQGDLTSSRVGTEQALLKNITNKAFEEALSSQMVDPSRY